MKQVIAKILAGSSDRRINEVTRLLNDAGVKTAEDLKYYDWNDLKELRGLSNMEVNKIMRYVQENFPVEYNEHKKKMAEERKIQHETDIFNLKAQQEKKIQEEKRKIEEERERRLKQQQQEFEELQRKAKDEIEKLKQNSSSITTDILGKTTNFCANIKKKFKSSTGNIEEILCRIFDGFPVERVNEIKRIFHENDVETEIEFKYFDWKLLGSFRGLTSEEIEAIMDFVKEKFPKDYKRHEQRRDEENKMKKEFAEFEPVADGKANIEEAISRIFHGFHVQRIDQIKGIFHKNDVKTEDELKYFDWRALDDLQGGLTSAEINIIMDFVKEKFPKYYKRHEQRRDEENKMKEELLKYENAASI